MPSMSPRTQQMQMAGGAGIDQATQMFEQGFSEMAYNVLLSRFPDLAQDVVTFKILDTDIDKGMGVGAFVLMKHDQPIYIPVVMSDNNVKPLELAYHKKLNIFLPLTKAWLEEADKTSLGTLGQGIKTPESLFTDVDIRNVVVPPITGRFSYASYVENPKQYSIAEAAELLEKTASEPRMALLDFLAAAPNVVKKAAARVFEKHPKVLKHAAAIYGVQALSEALRPRVEKTAAKQNIGGALWIADQDTTPTEFRRIFGDRAPEAYAGVRRKGYFAKDDRLDHNLVMEEQPYRQWVEPRQPGVYVLSKSDGTDAPALVLSNPIDIMSEGSRYGRRPVVPGHNPLVDNSYYEPDHYDPIRVYPEGRPAESDFVTRQHGMEFLAVLPNGDYLETARLAGRISVVDDVAGGPLHKRLFQDVSGAPKAGRGMWVRQKGTTFQATRPVEIKTITTDSNGTRRVTVTGLGGWPEKVVITDPTNPYGTIWMPKGANIVYLPPDFVWVPLKERLNPRDFFTSVLDVQGAVSHALANVGARKVSIKDASAGQYSIDGRRPMDKIATLKTLAKDYGLAVGDVEALLDKTASERHVTVWVASMEKIARAQVMLEKRAEDAPPKKKKAPPADAGADAAPADPMADPNMQAAMMASQQPPAPPPPTPTDLAAMEMDQQIQQEIQKLQEKQQMLAALTQRANEIAGGASPMPTVQSQAMGAPPPSMNMATGAPVPPPGMAPPPSMGGQPPMGGMPGGDPSMMGGQPGMDPSMMGGAAPGGALPMAPQDPSMGGMPGGDPSMMGGQPGMDPSMMGGQQPQQPMAMMGPDGPNAETLSSQVNPQFLDQAGQLQSADVFDAAAVSSLAQSPAVKELVGQYLPNLEKALDNLGRVLLTLWMQEPDLKQEIGEAAFSDLEDNLRNTMKSMGDLVLRLSQGAHVIKGQFDHETA